MTSADSTTETAGDETGETISDPELIGVLCKAGERWGSLNVATTAIRLAPPGLLEVTLAGVPLADLTHDPMTAEDDRLDALHATVSAALDRFEGADATGVDPAMLLEELGNRGVVVLWAETLRRGRAVIGMEAEPATPPDRGLLAALEAALANHLAGDPDDGETPLGDPNAFLLALGEQGVLPVRVEELRGLKARVAALCAAACDLVIGLGRLAAEDRAKVIDEIQRLLAEVNGVDREARGYVVVRRETLAEMQRATEEATRRAAELEVSRDNWRQLAAADRELDTWADVHLLGRTVRSGHLTASRQIPGFLDLVEPDGTRRAINPDAAVGEVEYRTEQEVRDSWAGRTIDEEAGD